MKNTILLILAISAILMTSANLPLNPSGLTWEEVYSFDRSNAFVMEFYAKNNELMRTVNIKTNYQSDGENFSVNMMVKGNGVETVIDKKNEVAIQIYGMGEGATPMYNAGGFKYPSAEELKKLELVPTGETKEILTYACKKYTTYGDDQKKKRDKKKEKEK